MAASLQALSASVTRILSLSGFPKELKTKDIQAAFSEWENVSGGFKIKWLDDTSLLLVFQDPGVAKRAYLQTIAFPPASLAPPNSDTPAIVKPYDGPDAQTIIQNVNARHNSTRGHNVRASSVSVSIPSHRNNNSNSNNHSRNGTNALGDREPSPTLPTIPQHPTLSALIGESMDSPIDPAILAVSSHSEGLPGAPPRIGDPAKRMLGAAMGVRHPGLGPRAVNGGGDSTLKDVQRAMAGLIVAE